GYPRAPPVEIRPSTRGTEIQVVEMKPVKGDVIEPDGLADVSTSSNKNTVKRVYEFPVGWRTNTLQVESDTVCEPHGHTAMNERSAGEDQAGPVTCVAPAMPMTSLDKR